MTFLDLPEMRGPSPNYYLKSGETDEIRVTAEICLLRVEDPEKFLGFHGFLPPVTLPAKDSCSRSEKRPVTLVRFE